MRRSSGKRIHHHQHHHHQQHFQQNQNLQSEQQHIQLQQLAFHHQQQQQQQVEPQQPPLDDFASSSGPVGDENVTQHLAYNHHQFYQQFQPPIQLFDEDQEDQFSDSEQYLASADYFDIATEDADAEQPATVTYATRYAMQSRTILTNEELDKYDLATETLPAVDTPDACDKAAIR